MNEMDVAIRLPFDLIQVLRLTHALVEAGCRIHVRPEDVPKLIQLNKVFGLGYEVGVQRVPVLEGLAVDHRTPETRVGSIARALIFPRAAFRYCRERWPEKRPVRACFPGRPMAERRETINAWLKLSQLDLRVPEQVEKSLATTALSSRIPKRIGRWLGIPSREYVFADGVKIIFSEEGRLFPRKAWNVDYYSWLLESQFVLCPDGDLYLGRDESVWTYRFFESVLCGAIPVIQHTCAAYEGFRVCSMEQPLSALRWSREDAEYNFDLALERLTVPEDELREEVSRLLTSPVSRAPSSELNAGVSSSAV